MEPITEREVFRIAFNRAMSDNLLKQTQIDAAKISWIYDVLPESFFADVEETPGDYTTLIEQYIHPIWAWGVVYNNFNYFTMQITDKGIVQMLIENTANVVSEQARNEAKMEIKQTIFNLIRRMDLYCKSKVAEDDPLFANYGSLKITPHLMHYVGEQRRNAIRY